jgi:hypothetical protein
VRNGRFWLPHLVVVHGGGHPFTGQLQKLLAKVRFFCKLGKPHAIARVVFYFWRVVAFLAGGDGGGNLTDHQVNSAMDLLGNRGGMKIRAVVTNGGYIKAKCAALVAGMLLLGATNAGATTYAVSLFAGFLTDIGTTTMAIGGSITTDGKLGILSPSDIVDWDLIGARLSNPANPIDHPPALLRRQTDSSKGNNDRIVSSQYQVDHNDLY